MTEFEIRDAVEDLTDAPCSFAAQHRARALARAWGPNGPYAIAELIDRTCQYYRAVADGTWDVALGPGSECPLQDWHDFSQEWRVAWEGYG